MSPLKYLVLAALGLGALALDSGTAEASMTNNTQRWCKSRGAEDQVIVQGDSSELVWTPDGNVVLQPFNKVVRKIWSSGTSGAGDKVCWETDGTLAVYDAAGARLWSQGGTGTVPEPDFSGTYRYKLSPWLSDCDFSARYVIDLRLTPPPIVTWALDVSHGKLWTRETACPKLSQGMVGEDWCLDAPAAGHELPILQSRYSELVWMPEGILVQRGTGIAAGREIWRSENGPAGTQVCFSPRGQLTIFDESHMPVFLSPADASTTSSHLFTLDDCDLTARRADGTLLWSEPHRCPQTTLSMGVQWTAGANDTVLLENAQARLVFQADGNLVLRSAVGDEVWHSGLSAGLGKRLAFQTDGNLVIYDASDKAAWGAKAWGQGITLLELDGCKFSLKTPTETKWSRGAATCPSETLTNSWTFSNSGALTLLRTPEARLVWQGNGGLVLRTTAGSTVWASGTGTSPGGYRKIAFQDDGNLVIYDGSGNALWSTGTWQTQSVQRRLRLGDHCKLTLEDLSGHVLWTGNDSCTVMNYSFEREDGDSKFGASLHTHLTAKDDGTARLDSDTGIDVTIFGKRLELFSATAYQTESDNGSDLNNASIAIFGITNPGANITYEKTFFEESKTYMVGPVPVTVSFGVTGELGLSLAFGGSAGLTVTPTAGIYATVSAGVGGECDLGGASAGIRGQLTLIEVGLPISLNLYLDSNGAPRYAVKGDLTLTSLSGSLELYAEAYVKICFVKISADWSYELFSWTGLEWTKNLFNQSGSF